MLPGPNASAFHDATKRGEGFVWTLTPGVLMTRLHGFLYNELTKALIEALDRQIDAQKGKVVVFADWSDVTAYHVQVRIDYTRWALRRRDVVNALHFYVKSGLVIMGMKVASFVLPMLHTYETEVAFEIAILASKA